MVRNVEQFKHRRISDKVFENRKLEWFAHEAGGGEGDDDGPAPAKKGKEDEDCD